MDTRRGSLLENGWQAGVAEWCGAGAPRRRGGPRRPGWMPCRNRVTSNGTAG